MTPQTALHTPPTPRPRLGPRPLGVACLLALAAASAPAQTWDYKSYKKDRTTGMYDKERFNTGTVTLTEKGGKAYFTMIAGTLDACLRGEVPAEVTRTAETTMIELKRDLSGCDSIRYIIRNDGSGGNREVKRGEEWVKDGFDHGLTPTK